MGNNEWMVGVALNIIGSISINAGTNLMKLGHNRRARDVCRVTNNCSSTVLTEAPSKQKQSDIDLDVRMVPSESSTVTEDSGNGSPDVAAAQSASTGKLLHRQGSSKSANSEASSKDGTERTPAGAAVVKPIYKYPVWAIGSSMFVVGNILNFASFGFAAQSLLSALGAIQFVSNVVFARFVLGEPVTWFTLIATAIIVVCWTYRTCSCPQYIRGQRTQLPARAPTHSLRSTHTHSVHANSHARTRMRSCQPGSRAQGSCPRTHAHAHTHTHAHAHAHAQAHAHRHTHRHKPTHTHARAPTHPPTPTHPHPHPHPHPPTHPHPHPHSHTRTHTHAHTHTLALRRARA